MCLLVGLCYLLCLLLLANLLAVGFTLEYLVHLRSRSRADGLSQRPANGPCRAHSACTMSGSHNSLSARILCGALKRSRGYFLSYVTLYASLNKIPGKTLDGTLSQCTGNGTANLTTKVVFPRITEKFRCLMTSCCQHTAKALQALHILRICKVVKMPLKVCLRIVLE